MTGNLGFKQVNFEDTEFWGCDFWGVTFRDCSFKNVNISDSVFMSCIFKDCNFSGAQFNYVTIVNTNLSQCANINTTQGIKFLKVYPKNQISEELRSSLDALKDNKNIRKYKLLHLPNKKYNELNIFFLLRKFDMRKLTNLLLKLNEKSTKDITTYKKLELVLRNLNKL